MGKNEKAEIVNVKMYPAYPWGDFKTNAYPVLINGHLTIILAESSKDARMKIEELIQRREF